MSNLVIVAIPDENDRVWKVSSEKVPHLTVLFLGDVDEIANADQITQFVEHAANTTLRRFYLPVDRRGELGDDKADVLFFKKGRYDYKAIRDFRVQLLKDNNIRTAYDSTTQFEGPWQPHLTLGYPDTPAKPDDTDRDYGFYDVAFNRIAVWFGDFEGPEFLLKDYWDEWETMETAPIDIAMSDASEAGSAFILEHYGVKGMRWGMQKGETSKGWLDPEGHDLGADVTKTAAGLIFPPIGLLTLPSNIRLARAAGRNIQTARKQGKVGREDAKFEKVAKSQETFVDIHNGSLTQANKAIGSINKKYPQDLTKDSAAKTKYDAEVLKAMQDAYRDSANRITNKRGDKHLDVEFHNDGQDFSIKVKDGAPKPTAEKVKHAVTIDEDDVVTFSGTIKRASTGHILGFSFEDFDEAGAEHSDAEEGAEFMVHSGLMTPDEFLEHFGVKGMLWGVSKAKSAGSATNKFVEDVKDIDAEPSDPTMAQSVEIGAEFLASIGVIGEDELEHFGVKGMRWGQRKAPPEAVTPMGTSRVPHGTRRKTKIEVEGGENHHAHTDAIKVAEARAKLKKSGTAALSNNELQTVAKRLQLETQVAQLTSSRGQKFITRQLEQQGQQTVQAGFRNPAGVAKGAKKVAKKAGKAAATGAVGLALL